MTKVGTIERSIAASCNTLQQAALAVAGRPPQSIQDPVIGEEGWVSYERIHGDIH